MVPDPVVHERLPCVVEHRVERSQKARRRAPIAGQRKAPLLRHIAAGLHIGKDIGPAEAVNGLFRIADEKQRAIGGGIHLPENVVLNRIGVLEFVDQGRLVFPPEGCGKGRAIFAVQRLIHVVQQVVEETDVALPFPYRQPVPAELDQLRPHTVRQLLAMIEEAVLRWRILLQFLFFHPRSAELFKAVKKIVGVATGRKGVHTGKQIGKQVGPVGVGSASKPFVGGYKLPYFRP